MVIRFDPQIKTIRWMRDMIRDNPGKLFNGGSEIYMDFWQSYVDLENIELPYEMSIPFADEYHLSTIEIKEDYTDWYRRNYNLFCEKIKEVDGILAEYLLQCGYEE